MAARQFEGSIWENADATFLARVKISSSGALANVTQAAVSTITYGVNHLDTGTQTGSGSLTVSGVVYDTLQTGTIWTADATGYNFLASIAASSFPYPGAYRVEFKWTLTGGTVFWLVYQVTVENVQMV